MSKEIGKKGENFIISYLRSSGVTLVSQNYYGGRYGEIDIIAREKDILVFIEVKARKAKGIVRAAAAVTLSKQRKIINAAQHYLMTNNLQQVPCRFDVIELYLDTNEINWIKDAFR